MSAISFQVSAPVCSFRKGYAREYLETEKYPPPSTVYGFLLSMIGEEDRWKYIGSKIAIAVTRQAEISTVLRTTWRVKSNAGPGIGNNKRPDYQEILTGLEFGVWIADCILVDTIKNLIQNPCSIDRFGGLSLGESRDLVDEVRFNPHWGDSKGLWLVNDKRGRYPLPVWVDHVGSKGTRWEQLNTMEAPLTAPPPGDPRWITIRPKDT